MWIETSSPFISKKTDEISERFSPEEKSKSTPQVQDRHFWKIESEKFISSEERVQVEIEQF